MMCIPNWSQSCHELLSWLAHLSMHQTHINSGRREYLTLSKNLEDENNRTNHTINDVMCPKLSDIKNIHI
jgi:hypothetical protein